MDRRSIIFIIGMTALFFLMNQWFQHGRGSVGKVETFSTQVEYSGDQGPKALSKSQMKQFGIISLYRDIDLNEFFCYAISKNDNYLTISSTDQNFPKQLYTRFDGETTSLTQRLELRVPPKKDGDPVLYSIYPLSKLTLPWIPDEGEYNVMLVYFEDQEIKIIKGTSYADKRAVFDSKPNVNAIAFLDFKGEFSPYGLYDREKDRILYLNDYPAFESFSILTFPAEINKIAKEKDQTYYVLENEYFQLVFSNLNGSLAEINLPFESESNPYSVVREIEFDRIIKKDYPDNDRFPQYPAIHLGKDGKKETLEPSIGGYYPLIRRDILGSAGDTNVDISPHYYATTIFEKDLFPFIQEYKLTKLEKSLIEFQYSDSKRKITKTFSIPKNAKEAPYCLDLTVNIEGDARQLVIGTGIPEVELISGSFNPTLKYRLAKTNKVKIEKIKTPKSFVEFPYAEADWICNGNGFFGIIIDPLNREAPGLAVHPVSGELVPTRLTLIDSAYQRYPSEKYPGYGMHCPILARPGQTLYRLFLGPFDKTILKTVDQTFTDSSTGYNPNYTGVQSYHGWFAFISQPFAKFLFIIMDFFHTITGSWGISIILLTIVLRLMLFPLNNWSMKSTAKMSKLAPKAKEIQEKYKKDPKRVQVETMNLYKREKVNPFGGCFPILIQLPFLFGMFDLLKSSFVLRGASFIPGWIDNLTAPDVLFSWNYPIPFFGTQFHLLPIILGVIMFFQQKIMSAGKAPTEQQKQQRSIGNIMTIAFAFMFYHFPSGLNIYWISSMLLGILQQWLVNKKINTSKS